jgi:hypothetical protein
MKQAEIDFMDERQRKHEGCELPMFVSEKRNNSLEKRQLSARLVHSLDVGLVFNEQ